MSCNKCDDCTIFDASKDFGTQLDEQSKSIRNMLLAVRMSSSVESILYKTLYQMACTDNQFAEALKALEKRAGKDWTQTINDIIAVNTDQTKFINALKAVDIPQYTTLADHITDQTIIPLSDDVRNYDEVMITYSAGSSISSLSISPTRFAFSDHFVNNTDNSSDSSVINDYTVTVNAWNWVNSANSEFNNSETGLWFGVNGKSLRKGLLANLGSSNRIMNSGGKPIRTFHRFDTDPTANVGSYVDGTIRIEKVQGVNYHVKVQP